MKNRINYSAAKLVKSGYDSILIADPYDIFYLTGFFSDYGYLLLTSNKELFYFTNFIYQKQAKKNSILKVKICDSDIYSRIVATARKLKHKHIGFERELSYGVFSYLEEKLSAANIAFSRIDSPVKKLRMIKDKSEINHLKRAAAISEEAFGFIEEIYTPRMSEKELSIEIEKFLRLKGDNEIAFSTIVASGSNSVLPHHSPGPRGMGNNFFLIDLGSKYYGYCADLTKVFFWGKMPQLFRKIFDTVLKASELSIKKIRDGASAAEIDKIARDTIEKKGWGKYFGHGLGHGIGLQVHEPPYLKPESKSILKEGMVITIEPAVYFRNKFGIRVENMVLVKAGKGELINGNLNK
ncbi:MAG: M24 family metallopeptidase [Candidatus Omnitrophica bacterium]|nr:M24 family metallopeptidase [Candidatus Omnitrophota bacterium]MBD3269659.1 M24 family metallopeptidase [Candidatus Omnitrophota bacterium]